MFQSAQRPRPPAAAFAWAHSAAQGTHGTDFTSSRKLMIARIEGVSNFPTVLRILLDIFLFWFLLVKECLKTFSEPKGLFFQCNRRYRADT